MPNKYLQKILYISSLAIIHSSILSPQAQAQIFSGDQNPLSVKWRQINQSGFQVIYPTELEKEAQRMANTLGHIYPLEAASLGLKNTRLPVVLQNRGVIANGFVALAPRRSEFNTTPPQYFDSQDWLNNLAIHELRHAVQYDKLTNGMPSFTQEISLALLGASIPLWFFEGDAVGIETALTEAGRGRQPSWIMPYRTMLLEGQKLSYSKANFGSGKTIVPGYYQLGYVLTSGIRAQAGKQIFDSLLTDIRQRPFRLYPFASSLKKLTGKTGREWFLHSNAQLKKEWKDQEQKTGFTAYAPINQKAKFATDYHMPRRLENGSILALKQSKSRSAHFVLIDSLKNEKILFGIAYQEQPWYSYANGVIVWDEIRYDPRFQQRSYSVINVHDMATRKSRKLLPRTRLFSPSLSPDGKKIVAIDIDLSNQVSLLELEVATGKTLRRFMPPAQLTLQSPAYSRSGDSIAYVSVSEQGKALWLLDHAGKTTQLLPETRQQLNRPQFTSTGIAFNAHYSGLDNIYHLDLTSKEISALSKAKYGAFNPGFDSSGQEFLFSNYGPTGFDIASAMFNPQKMEDNHFYFAGAATVQQENTGDVFDQVPDSTFSTRPYRKLGHLFNFHSLSPVIESDYVGGLEFRSHNLLNTVSATAGANYHSDLNRFEYSAGLSVKSFYPIINLDYENRPVRSFYTAGNTRRQGDWRENYLKLSAQIPLNLIVRDEYYNLAFNLGTSLTKRYMPENLPSNFITSLNFPMEYRFTFSHGKRQAERDVAPRWAQIFRVKYFHQPFDKRLSGDLLSFENFIYTPGLGRNHSFLVNFNYQKADGVRRFNREINAVYGYNNIKARTALSNTLLLNYRFPLAFPDAELGPLAYIKNLRATLFTHYENFGTETQFDAPKTYGFELRSSMNLLRYDADVEFGGRMVFVNRVYRQNPILELIFNYSF